MTATAARAEAAPYVEASFNYIAPDCHYSILYEEEREASTLRFEPHVARIHDGRAAGGFTLEANGFELIRHESAADLFDPAQVATTYRAEVEAIIKEKTGATDVLMFGEVLRREPDPTGKAYQPARSVHVDFDEKTVRNFVRGMVSPQEADRLLAKKRIVLMNLWRGLTTVERAPLAVCDASTIAAGDLRTGDIGGRAADAPWGWTGYNIAHNPAHRWWWFPRMAPDEVLLFKLCDSDKDRVQLTAHTAFDDPASALDASPRQSLEVRTISFYD